MENKKVYIIQRVVFLLTSITLIVNTIKLASAQEYQPNCGITSVLSLTRIENKAVSTQLRSDLVKQYPETQVSLFDVQSMAKSVNIPLVGVKSTFNDLLTEQKPAIIHLQNPDHFVLMMDGNEKWVRLLEMPDSMISIIPRAEIEKRFDGYALIKLPNDSDATAPSLHFVETNFQKSTTGIGQQLKHAYGFTNTGKRPLEITIKSTSCGCTSAFIGKGANSKTMTIAPETSGSVQVSMNVNQAGTQEQMVTLQTNDPQRPLVYLTIVASSPQNIGVSPVSLYLNSDKGQVASRMVQIIGPSSMKILSVETDHPELTTTLISGDTNNVSHTWKVNVVRSSSATVGDYKATIKIHTDNAERPLITIPVTGQVTGDVHVTPSSAFFGFVKANQQREVTLAIQSRSGTPFQITNIKLIGGNSQILQFVDQDKGNKAVHHLDIKLKSSQPAFLQEQLIVETNVPGEEKIVIPVTGLVQQ